MKIEIDREAERLVKRGNPVILGHHARGSLTPNSWVYVYGPSGFLGSGFTDGKTIRLYTREKVEFGEELIQELLARAKKKRRYRDFYRWVYSEADWFPGLTVDLYRDLAVLRITYGPLDPYRHAIARELGVEHVYEKSTGTNRKRAGLEEREGFLLGNKEEVMIKEGSAEFYVNVHGQKTGFYLDLREARLLFEKLAGEKVLDLFSYTGGFGIHAAVQGASVTMVDMSEYAERMARRNMELNGVAGTFVRADVFSFLKKHREKYDTVVVDPPSFPKDPERALFFLNKRAMMLLSGLLVSCTCTQSVTPSRFVGLLHTAASELERDFSVLSIVGQAPDHPYLPALPQTKYLKCVFAWVE